MEPHPSDVRELVLRRLGADPPTGIERRKRGLHLEVQDARQQQLHLECFQHLPAVAKAVKSQLAAHEAGSGQTYRAEARELGVGWDHLRMRVDVAGSLPKLAAAQAQSKAFGAHLQASWRLLSGFEHGLSYAALRGSDTSADVKIPGGQSMRLVVNDDALVSALKTTYFLFLTAARLYERRCTRSD